MKFEAVRPSTGVVVGKIYNGQLVQSETKPATGFVFPVQKSKPEIVIVVYNDKMITATGMNIILHILSRHKK